MLSASFICPYDSVFKLLQFVVKKKDYIVSSADENEGIIKAQKKKSIFNKGGDLDIMVYTIDKHSTGVKIMINNNALVSEKSSSLEAIEEKRLLSTINKYF